MPIADDLITPALWNLQIPKQPSETLDEFEKHCAAVTRLMSNPRMAALLSTMAVTPEVYIEANHYASTYKNPDLGLLRDLGHNKSGTPNPQQSADRPTKPP
jgi:hypothetical protein